MARQQATATSWVHLLGRIVKDQEHRVGSNPLRRLERAASCPVDERAVAGTTLTGRVGREVLATNASRRCPRLLVFSEVLFRLATDPQNQ